MKTQTIWLAACALCLAACSEGQPPADPSPAAAQPAADATKTRPEPIVDQAFIEHMHEHADKLDNLMFALDDGDLEAALTAAYWLGGHQSPEGIRPEWQPFLAGMREAALGVELATDIETARAAAGQISTHCQACHAAAGIVTDE